MIKITLYFAILVVPAFSAVAAEDVGEAAAIKAAAMDYVEGWYQGDVDRMARSLHPDLAKRTVVKHPKTGEPILTHLSKSTMLAYTKAGGGKETPKEKLFYDIAILDVHKGIAMVKAVSANYVDYIHLAKWHDRWMIVNIIWDQRQG